MQSRRCRAPNMLRDAHIGGGLVKDEDTGALQQRPRHAQQLPLPGAHVAAALHHRRVQAALGGQHEEDLASRRCCQPPAKIRRVLSFAWSCKRRKRPHIGTWR